MDTLKFSVPLYLPCGSGVSLLAFRFVLKADDMKMYKVISIIFITTTTNYWIHFGCSDNAIAWGFISTLTPIDFIHKHKTTTKTFGYMYHLCMDVLILICFLYYDQSQVKYLMLFLVLNSIPKLLYNFYYKTELLSLYNCRELSYPNMMEISRRKDSFPPNSVVTFPENVDISELISDGHFYIDYRIKEPITICYACGQRVDWSPNRSEARSILHTEHCARQEELNPLDNESTKVEEQGKWKQLLILIYKLLKLSTMLSFVTAEYVRHFDVVDMVIYLLFSLLWLADSSVCFLNLCGINSTSCNFCKSCLKFLSSLWRLLQSLTWLGIANYVELLKPLPVAPIVEIGLQVVLLLMLVRSDSGLGTDFLFPSITTLALQSIIFLPTCIHSVKKLIKCLVSTRDKDACKIEME